MNINLLIRRIHLYLGLFLLAWLLMYGISSLAISHHDYINKFYDDGVPDWTERFERPYSRPVPEGADLRQVAALIMEDVGLESSFGVYRASPQRLVIYFLDFWSSTRLIYFIDQGKIVAEDKRFRWDHFLGGLHGRSGFQQDSFLDDVWAVIVDIFCLAIIFWIASGIYIWWKVRQARFWGVLALGGGVVSFLIFILAL